MKKFLALLMIFALSFCSVTALADVAPVPVLVESGYTAPVSCYSDQQVTMTIDFTQDEYGYLNGYTIYINGTYASREGVCISGNVYAVDVSNWGKRIFGTLFMVEDYGMDDYAMLYCYLATDDGSCYDLGYIPGRIESITFNADGTLSTTEYTDVLGTWNYSVDYVLALGCFADGEEWVYDYSFVSIPKDIIPMGSIVTLNVDLPVLATVMDSAYSGTIAGGQRVILTATDLTGKVYVSTVDGSAAGWVWINTEEGTTKIAVNGEWMEEATVFSDILYAG